jgi:hypothetical protein
MQPTTSTSRKAYIVARYRDLAARDLRNNISWAIMICCAMFYISADQLTDAESAARARNPTWLWWSKRFGEELNWRPIQTKLCLGVDDVTIVAKQGATPTEYEWHAVDLDEADHRYSYFTVQDAEGRNFLLRARFTMVAAGEGHKCRIIMTISNLTVEQLGGHSFKVIKVRGCTVNAGWNPSAVHDSSPDNYGLLLLQTGGGDVDVENTKYIYENEIEPMIEAIRMEDPTYDARARRPKDTAVLMADGAICPLKYSGSHDTLQRHSRLGVRMLKTAAGCSPIQAAVRFSVVLLAGFLGQ